jgi:16S rRNA (adenine1518-N6/adenine1519-N6)-dimethyltransferase
VSFPVARKSLGQHFLHEKNVVENIIREFDPRSSDIVVEIGPGLGALTFDLIPKVGQLHAVELDRGLVQRLEIETTAHEHVHVHHADALKVDFCALCPGEAIRLIGNLPYNISTPLLFHLLQYRNCIRDMWFMLQKEVGERIVAVPGTKRYGRLSVMIQQCCRVELIQRIGSGAFSPPPKVESAVVRLTPYETSPYPVDDYGAFERVVRAAFSQRRKTLRNALMTLISEQRIAETGIDSTLRAEQLSVNDYVELSRLL